jgi:hypothetical protein
VAALVQYEDVSGESPMTDNASEEATATAPVQSPFCGRLRSKKYFMLDRLATSAEDYIDGANHVWCFETQEVIGPDNRRVSPENCGPGRSCYVSAIK